MKTSVPLYQQMKNALMRQIQDRCWAQGELIPSEPELAAHYNVSRTTVRQAVGDLVSMGYLVRQQGKGTFVAKRKNTRAASPLCGFAEELRQRGYEVNVNVRQVAIRTCPDRISNYLEVKEVPVIYVSRTACVGDTCVFYETSYLVPPIQLTERDLLEKKSTFDYIYGFFEQNGVRIGLGRQTLRAEHANVDDVEYLNVTHGDPVLVVRRVTQDVTGTPVEFSEVRYPGKLYEYEINLYREER